MSLEFSVRICPFWNGNKLENFQCEASGGNCCFSFARDRFLVCIEYLSEIQKKIKKHKMILRG